MRRWILVAANEAVGWNREARVVASKLASGPLRTGSVRAARRSHRFVWVGEGGNKSEGGFEALSAGGRGAV